MKMEEMSNSSDSLEVIEVNGEANKNNEENIQENVSDGEEGILMTAEEAVNQVMEKIEVLLNDPNSNPLLAAKLEILEYEKKIKQKADELKKVCKSIELLYTHQVKFLQHQGLMTKPPGKSVGVSIDLPFLPETMSALLRNPANKITNSSGEMKLPANKSSSGPVECIDLTDELDTPEPPHSGSPIKVSLSSSLKQATHPAPLPPCQGLPDFLHKPQLKIKANLQGIVLTWDLPENRNVIVLGYEVFYYQEQNHIPPSSHLWRKIVCLDPLQLPMSCLLSHLEDGYKYHFAVRAVRVNSGPFSDPVSIMFTRKK